MRTGYKPTPIGKRRRHQRGKALAKRRQQYRKNRSKAKIQHHLWYQKNKNKPAFKRRQKMRRQNPQRFKMRRGSESDIAFVLGPEMEMGCVLSVHPESGVVSYLVGGKEKEMEAMDFLKSVVFLTPEDMDQMFDLIDETWGVEGYADWDLPDPTPELAARVASLFLGASGMRPAVSRDDLTPEEKAAIKAWSGATHGGIQKGLRSDLPHPLVPLLDSAIEKSTLPGKMTLYRGLTKIPPGLERVGGFFKDKGYMATSRDPLEKTMFKDYHHVVITVPAGTPALFVGKSPYNEVLLPRNSTLRVDGIESRLSSYGQELKKIFATLM